MSFFSSLLERWPLVVDLAWREALGRYKNSLLGVFWSLLTPLAMLAVYTFVFSGVFQARWPGARGESTAEFAVVLFAGLAVFGFFAECITKAPSIIVLNATLVKKVVFPVEVLPVVTVMSALFHLMTSLVLLQFAQLFLFGSIPVTTWLVPVVLLPLLMLTVGLCWLLSALGVYMRDVHQTVTPIVTALMFLSPIFFPASALPERWQWLVNFNPLAIPIEMARQVLVFGQLPDWAVLARTTALNSLVAWAGLVWFRLTRKGFADVL